MDLNHQMELISIAMTTAVCAKTGCNWSVRMQDFGVDLNIHGENWPLQPQIDIQLKSTRICHAPLSNQSTFKYPLRVKNYNDLRAKTIRPQLLLLVLVPEAIDEWLIDEFDRISFKYGLYWVNLRGRPPTTNRQTVTIEISLANRFNAQSLEKMMTQLNQRGEIRP